MPRGVPQNQSPSQLFDLGVVAQFAHTVGQLMGQGFGQGLSASLPTGFKAGLNTVTNGALVKRGPGRPPKAKLFGGAVPSDRMCTVSGCKDPIKSLGLCSKHYQAKRRKMMKAKTWKAKKTARA